MKKIGLVFLIVALVCAFAFTGCAKTEAPAQPAAADIVDVLGNEVEVKSIDKIISLSPAATEILYALGVGDKIIGVDSYSYYPEDATTKEVVGDFNGPDVEKIVSMEPDIVLCGNTLQQEQIDSMKKLGLTVVATEAVLFEDIEKSIDLIGNIVGKQDEAKKIIDTINSAAEEAAKNAPAQKKSVYFVMSFGDMGNWTSGPGSFINTIIEMAGGDPVTKDAEFPWIEYKVEDLVISDPDILILSSTGGSMEDLVKSQGYSDLTAVKNGAVYVIDADVISRPGPRIAEAITLVSDILNK